MIGRDSALTAEEGAYLQETVTALEEEVFTNRLGREHFRALDDNEETTADWREFMRRCAAEDLLGIAVPRAYNGAGEGYVETVLAEQALGYAGCIIHACQVSLTQHVGRTLYEHGTDHVKEEYLKPLLDGERILAQAFTEPTVGTDLQRLRTTGRRDGNEWIIDGQKRFIDFAGHCDFLLVPARTAGDDGNREGISLFVVDADADGYEILERQSPNWHGFRGSDACWIEFDDVRVPREHVVGEEGGAWPYITSELNLEHLTVARYCLGAAERALEVAANYTQHRRVNERPVADYQAVNHAVAECATKLDAAYLLNTRAARVLDRDGLGAGRMEGSMAGWFGNEVAHDIADTSMQMMGGISVTQKYPVERIQRDVRAGRFLGGTTNVLKSIVQHDVYDRLSDEDFQGSFVGAELDGSPWRDSR